jgi:hypothetical protein
MHLDHKTKELPSKGEHSDDPKAWQDEGFTYLPARADCTQIESLEKSKSDGRDTVHER